MVRLCASIIYIADEFDLPLVNRYVTDGWSEISGMFQSGEFKVPSTLHRRNLKTEVSL